MQLVFVADGGLDWLGIGKLQDHPLSGRPMYFQPVASRDEMAGAATAGELEAAFLLRIAPDITPVTNNFT